MSELKPCGKDIDVPAKMSEFSSIDEIPKKCIKCLHHKITQYGGRIDYCDYIERWEGN